MLVATNNQNERQEDTMPIPFNAPGGELEELLRGDFGKQILNDLHTHGHTRWGLQDLLGMVPPLNQGPQAILDWRMRRNKDEFYRRHSVNVQYADESDPDNFDIVDVANHIHDKYRKNIHWKEHEALKAYLWGFMQRGLDTDEELLPSQLLMFNYDMDRLMRPHGKSEIVFRGVRLLNYPVDWRHRVNSGQDEGVTAIRLRRNAWWHRNSEAWHRNSGFTSTSTIMNLPAWFAMPGFNDHNSTILEMEITPNVKTIVAGGSLSEIIIERNAEFEILKTYSSGLRIDSEPLAQYAKVRVHPPGTRRYGPFQTEL